MNRSDLMKRFPELSGLAEKNLDQVVMHLQSAPDWLLQKCSLALLSSNNIFIREGEELAYIYLLVDGSVKAIDYRVLGFEYEFVQFSHGYAFGGMEVIMDLNHYCTTLKTGSLCLFIKIPCDYFSKWIHSDMAAMQYEAKKVAEYLLEQGRLARAYLFLPAPERLAKILVGKYNKHAKDGILIDHSTRQELSNEAGFGIRTITRAIKALVDEGLITKNERGIVVNSEQYLGLTEMINALIIPECPDT